MGSPARGYSWPAFAPNNTAALTHGADSERMVAPVAVELVDAALGFAEWLADPIYRPAVEAWARAEARALLVHRWLEQHGQLTDDGDVRPAAEYAVRLEHLAARQRERLGLDPTSRAKLERETTVTALGQADLDAIRNRGRQVLEAAATEAE